MTAYRRIKRLIATAAAGVSILVGVTACHLPFTSDDVAGAVKVIAPAIGHKLPKVRESIAEIPGALSDLNETTEGPVRDAVIETACDAAAQGGNDQNWESDTLQNLLSGTQPPAQQLLNSVQDLVTTFSNDENNGITTTEKVGLVCKAYLLKDNFG